MSRGDDRPRGGQWTTALVIAALGVAAIAGLAVAVQDEFEPNDQFETAAEIDAGTYENLQVNNGGYDFYAVDLQEGAEVQVRIDFVHDDGDLDMRLFPGEDERMVDESATYNDYEEVSYTADEDATYFVSVYEYNGGSNAYDMEVEVTPPADESSGEDGSTSEESDTDGGTTDGDGGTTDDGGSTDASADDGESEDDTMLLLGLAALAAGAIGYIVANKG